VKKTYGKFSVFSFSESTNIKHRYHTYDTLVHAIGTYAQKKKRMFMYI
jgi:hypothetical protein